MKTRRSPAEAAAIAVKIRELYAAGLTQLQIAQTLDIKRPLVAKYLHPENKAYQRSRLATP